MSLVEVETTDQGVRGRFAIRRPPRGEKVFATAAVYFVIAGGIVLMFPPLVVPIALLVVPFVMGFRIVDKTSQEDLLRIRSFVERMPSEWQIGRFEAKLGWLEVSIGTTNLRLPLHGARYENTDAALVVHTRFGPATIPGSEEDRVAREDLARMFAQVGKMKPGLASDAPAALSALRRDRER